MKKYTLQERYGNQKLTQVRSNRYETFFCTRQRSGGHLLEDVLVVYVLEDRDEARQLVLHLVLRHSLRRFLEEVVTVFGQLDGRTDAAEKTKKVETGLSRALVVFSAGGEKKKKKKCVRGVFCARCTDQFGGFADGLWLSEVHHGCQRLTKRDVRVKINISPVCPKMKTSLF